MADAKAVEFLTKQTSGVGTQLKVRTRVGIFITDDYIEITEWEEELFIGIRHLGTIRGVGSFRLDSLAGGTRLTWEEDLRFPWRLGGQLTGFIARPILQTIWRRNLMRLESRLGRPG